MFQHSGEIGELDIYYLSQYVIKLQGIPYPNAFTRVEYYEELISVLC